MDISSSSLALSASHASFRQASSQIRMQLGSEPAAAGDRVRFSAAARAASEAPPEAPATDPVDAIEADGKFGALIRLIELLTGEAVRIFDAGSLHEPADAAAPSAPAAAPTAPARAPQPQSTTSGTGLSIEASRSEVEFESTSVSIAGRVRTADGQEIAFELELQMQRFHAESERLLLRVEPAAQRKDPLVINFGGTAAQLLDTRFQFDLDADGAQEALPSLAAGSGFLVFDRNRNGRIDDGRELFGAQSGDGFADLARLDLDGNGWIDGRDPVLAQLGVWDGRGPVRSLQGLGVEALATASVASPFALRGRDNSDLGVVRSTGVYLDGAGRPGSLQQVDLTV